MNSVGGSLACHSSEREVTPTPTCTGPQSARTGPHRPRTGPHRPALARFGA